MNREIRSWLTDMDGVLVHEGHALPGATEFIGALRAAGRPFLILTNNSIFTPGDLPATGAVAAMITAATGRKPYFVGKPNPMMFRSALNRIDAHSESTAMIGDRMDTDIVAGIEAGLQTFLVLTGSTKAHEVDRFPFRPSHVVDSIADLVERV